MVETKELEAKLFSTFRALKRLDETQEIARLRLRADVAEVIGECYDAGMSRDEVAKVIGLSPSRVTRLVQGNYVVTSATVRRPTEPSNEFGDDERPRVTPKPRRPMERLPRQI